MGGACGPTGLTAGDGGPGEGVCASVPVFEPPAVVASLDDVAMVRDAIQERGGHLGVTERFMMPVSSKGWSVVLARAAAGPARRSGRSARADLW